MDLFEAFQHGHLLTMQKPEYRSFVEKFLKLQLSADLREKDITVSSLFPHQGMPMKAEILAEENGIVAGLEELSVFLQSHKITMTKHAKDGTLINTNQVIATLTGSVGELLKTERRGLDLLGRMSGVASMTHGLIKKAGKVGKTALAATRKTLWGLMDKKAVYLGGGLTHRLGLWQAILVKDTHLVALKNTGVHHPLREAFTRVSNLSSTTPLVEIEVETPEEARELFKIIRSKNKTRTFPLAILLDNFSTKNLREVVDLAVKEKVRDKIFLEASGGITSKNMTNYIKTKVDLISLGSLTHSALHFNFSQRIVPQFKS